MELYLYNDCNARLRQDCLLPSRNAWQTPTTLRGVWNGILIAQPNGPRRVDQRVDRQGHTACGRILSDSVSLNLSTSASHGAAQLSWPRLLGRPQPAEDSRRGRIKLTRWWAGRHPTSCSPSVECRALLSWGTTQGRSLWQDARRTKCCREFSGRLTPTCSA